MRPPGLPRELGLADLVGFAVLLGALVLGSLVW